MELIWNAGTPATLQIVDYRSFNMVEAGGVGIFSGIENTELQIS
jgi:hypothetical protein